MDCVCLVRDKKSPETDDLKLKVILVGEILNHDLMKLEVGEAVISFQQ